MLLWTSFSIRSPSAACDFPWVGMTLSPSLGLRAVFQSSREAFPPSLTHFAGSYEFPCPIPVMGSEGPCGKSWCQ